VDAQSGELAARELGLEHAEHPVVLFVDDDVLAGPGMVSGHAAHHAQAPGLVVVGAMPVAAHRRARAAERLYAAWYDQQVRGYEQDPAQVLRSLWAGNVSLPRDAARRVGLSNSAFDARYNGDRELGLRLLRAGLEGRYDPALRAEHIYERSPRAFLDDARATGEGTWLVHALHGDLIGPYPADDFERFLSPAMAAAVRLARRPRAAPLVAAIAALARAAAALRLEGLAEHALTLAFNMLRVRAALARSRRP
jgi:hypothetical protein